MTTTHAKQRTQLDPDFGVWLRAMRKMHKLTIVEAARQVGVSATIVQELEGNRRRNVGLPVLETFIGIAELYGVELGFVLHKAGLNIGAAGVDIARLTRMEHITEAFAQSEHQLRRAIAEAMQLLDDTTPEYVGLSRALLALDVVTERLRVEGALGGTLPAVKGRPPSPDLQRRRETRVGVAREWSEQELEFLRSNPGLSHAAAAAQLGRTVAGVRFARRRMQLQEQDNNNGSEEER